MEWRLGTMGFSYPHWIGAFYPHALKPGDYLRFYSEYFDTVELDTTWHAMPDANRVRRWHDETPAHFRFAAKVPREITHESPIDTRVDRMHAFLQVMRDGMGEKLAVVVLQFGPAFSIADFSKLDSFLGNVKRDVRLAVEFRHRSWFVPATAALLRKHNAAWVAADLVGVPRQIVRTSDFLYVRWVGEHERFADKYGEEQADLSDRIEEWKRQLDKRVGDVDSIYGFFNNDFEGYSIGSVNKLLRMVGLGAKEPKGEPQQKLF